MSDTEVSSREYGWVINDRTDSSADDDSLVDLVANHWDNLWMSTL
jgi:hypothetical protein